MVKLADTPDLGSGGASHGGSSPSARTIQISQIIGSRIPMEISHVTNEGLKQRYQVVVSANQIEDKTTKKLMMVSQGVKIAGFRPGKVPLQVVQKRFGDQVLKETFEDLFREAVNQLAKKDNISFAQDPTINVEKYEKDNDLVFTIDFELLPEVTPADFSQIELKKYIVDITDTEVDSAIDDIYQDYQHFEAPKEPRPIKAGDKVAVDVIGPVFINGKVKKGPTHLSVTAGNDHPLFSGNFEKAVMDKAVGDVIEVTDNLGSSPKLETLKNAEFKFKGKITSIQEPVSLELNDDFANAFHYKTLNELKKTIHKKISTETENLSFMILKRSLLDKLSELHTFLVPEGLVDLEFAQIWKHLQDELNASSENNYYADKSEDELKEEYRSISKRRVQLGLLFSELASKHNFKPTENEIQAELMKLVNKHPDKIDEIIQHYTTNKKAMHALMSPVIEDKIVQFILDQVKLIEEKIDMKSFQKEVDRLFPTYDSIADDDSDNEEKSEIKFEEVIEN